MLTALLISQVVLWILLLVMVAVQLAVLRQVGVLHERIAPLGALTIDKGPKEGESAPLFDLVDLRGRRVRIGSRNDEGRSTLLFFLSPTCPVCKKMLPILRSLGQAEQRWLQIVLASDGDRDEHERFLAAQHIGDFPYVLSLELGMSYHIGKLPYAVLIDEAGVVRAKGLINTREHLESLIEAKERGVASIQEYLRTTGEHAGSQSG
ncbi:MAG TPA: methylamine dehydrogenase accessory protein MauD [Candidatus Margulisiibacteriota bacterium]|nr:methylamine dehydrogenase accessory protein MauD [Candidatus Margulisiibacteriota bacterium]